MDRLVYNFSRVLGVTCLRLADLTSGSMQPLDSARQFYGEANHARDSPPAHDLVDQLPANYVKLVWAGVDPLPMPLSRTCFGT